MREFNDLNEYLRGADAPGLILPINGVRYEILPVKADVGAWCNQMHSVAKAINNAHTAAEVQHAADMMEDAEKPPRGLTIHEALLGDAHETMFTDGVDHVRMQIVTMAVFAWVVGGDRAAEAVWTTGGHPERYAPADNRGSRRNNGSPTALAIRTQSPASTSATSSPRTSRRQHGGRRSRGRKS